MIHYFRKTFKRTAKKLVTILPKFTDAIVLWTPENIGDFLMTTPTVRAIVHHYLNKNKIFWCVAKSQAELARRAHIQAEIISLSNSILRSRPNFSTTDYLDFFFYELKPFWRHRISQFFVFGASTHKRELGVKIAQAVRSKEIILRDIEQIENCVNKGKNLKSVNTTHLIHWIDKYATLADAVGIDVKDRNLSVLLPKDTLKNFNIIKPYFVIHPGGYEYVNTRRWPKTNFIALAKKLLKAYPQHHLYITGGEEEREYCETICQATKNDRIQNFAGELSISASAQLYRNAACLITNDTGSLHLADAVECARIIAVFGPTDPRRIAPRNERCIVITEDLDCRPCVGEFITISEVKCPFEKQWCLINIETERVFSTLIDFLKA